MFPEISDMEKEGPFESVSYTTALLIKKYLGLSQRCRHVGYMNIANKPQHPGRSEVQSLFRLGTLIKENVICIQNNGLLVLQHYFSPNRICLLQSKLKGGNVEILAWCIHRDQMADRYRAGFCSGVH